MLCEELDEFGGVLAVALLVQRRARGGGVDQFVAQPVPQCAQIEKNTRESIWAKGSSNSSKSSATLPGVCCSAALRPRLKLSGIWNSLAGATSIS